MDNSGCTVYTPEILIQVHSAQAPEARHKFKALFLPREPRVRRYTAFWNDMWPAFCREISKQRIFLPSLTNC
ncbi:hypothetical protein AMS68_002806 [Peltaster fructicola]|uniref:Uncharacterized protein n=1 Tax=Peltaster fructicola TaxID=286661 RepID=A0A6H0XRN5_9PEZI|nr:hypothetical protein AMS68_002806 [Peltaster fructicola]